MATFPFSEINNELKKQNLIKADGNVVSFAEFKKLANIHQYGRGQRRLFIIFVYNSHPKDGMFAFYPPTTNKPEMLSIAYDYLVDVATTDMKQEYLNENVIWGNGGIPLSYGKIRQNYIPPMVVKKKGNYLVAVDAKDKTRTYGTHSLLTGKFVGDTCALWFLHKEANEYVKTDKVDENGSIKYKFVKSLV